MTISLQHCTRTVVNKFHDETVQIVNKRLHLSQACYSIVRHHQWRWVSHLSPKGAAWLLPSEQPTERISTNHQTHHEKVQS